MAHNEKSAADVLPPELVSATGPPVPDNSKALDQGIAADPLPVPCSSDETAQFWKDRQSEFDRLSTRQRQALKENRDDKWVRGYCFYDTDRGDLSRCRASEAIDGTMISEFEYSATKSAVALRFPEGTRPVSFWIYCLAQDLLKSSRPEIRREIQGGPENQGIIHDLLGSSVGYCSRLAARAEVLRGRGGVPEGLASNTISQLTFDLLHFQWAYPNAFPADAQQAIEDTRVRANEAFSAARIASYDDLSAAKYSWLLELASGAAPVFGRVAALWIWSPNERRSIFREYADAAALAGHLTLPALRTFYASIEWKSLDDFLFPPNESVRSRQTPEFWRELQSSFDVLIKSQAKATTNCENWVTALFISDHPGDLERCRIHHPGHADGRFISDIQDLVTRAGYGLDVPQGADPLKYWIYRLVLNIKDAPELEIREEFKLSDANKGHGWISDFLGSSASYCSRLSAGARTEKHRSPPSTTSSPQLGTDNANSSVERPPPAGIVIPSETESAQFENAKNNEGFVGQADGDTARTPEDGIADFASDTTRMSMLAEYIKRRACSEAALARTANVDPADLSKWKKGSLPARSEKKARIEKALRNDEPPTPLANRSENS